MPRFLMIETATEACSVALADEHKIICERFCQEYKAHAKLLATFVTEVLNEAHTDLSHCDAVSVSEGPGSYTGLRVGVSTAKGLCFGAGLPLIGVGTLDILASMALNHIITPDTIIIPMIDARRMEVYCAKFNNKAERISEIEPLVLQPDSFSKEFDQYSSVIFIGDGVDKYKPLLPEEYFPKSIFLNCCPSAWGMRKKTADNWERKEFKDTAYFEPFYLKEFIAGISKKSLL